jgi:hypothetical protein
MDIFQYLNNLWHDDYLFYNFLDDERDLDKMLFFGDNGDWNLFKSVNNLQNVFNVVNISDNFLDLFHKNKFFHHFLHLYNLSGLTSNFNNLLLFSDNFLHFLDDHWYLNNLFYNSLYIIVDSHHLRYYLLNFNKFRHFYQYFFQPLHLIYFWQRDRFLNNFLDNLLRCDNLLNC